MKVNVQPEGNDSRSSLIGKEAERVATDAQKSGRARWVVAVAVLVLLTEQSALGFTLVAPALTGISVKYETTQVIWAITIFTLVGGVVTPLMGKLADRFGKRKILLYAAGIAVVGSVISALAPSFELFLAGRALTGFSVVFLPVTFALMRDVFPDGIRDMSISIATNGVGVVSIAGPFMAGFLIDNISMEAIFWFIAALSAVGALGTIALVPESPVRNIAPIDFIGAAGLAAGTFLLLLGVSQISQWDLTDPRTLALLGGGVAILVAWWVWERRTIEPFVDTRVLTSRSMAPVISTYAFGGAAITIGASYLPTFLQTPRMLAKEYGFGLSSTDVAVYFVLGGSLTVLGGVIVGMYAKRYGFRMFLILGSAFIIIGMVGLSIVKTEAWGPVVLWGVVGLGTMIYAAAPNLLMKIAPAEQRGVSAGMLGTSSAILGSLGAQIAGLILGKNIADVVGGFPIYTGSGISYVFLLAAAFAVVGLIAAVFVPRKERALTPS